MTVNRRWRIALVGMEELPALTALRLRQAGFHGARALEGLRGLPLGRATAAFDVIHCVYPLYYFKWAPIWKAMGKRVVFHWIGSDFYRMSARRTWRTAFAAVRRVVDLHIADAPWLLADLRAAGARAFLVPTISEKMTGARLEPLPARFRILAYVPDRRRDFYGWPTVKVVAAALPAVEVWAVGGGADAAAPANVRWLGYLDEAGMAHAYRETSVLVRPTQSDGLSQMVLEALARGRQVIWTREFPYCLRATTPEEFVAAAARLAASCPLNEEGARFVAAHYTAAAAAQALAAAYDTL